MDPKNERKLITFLSNVIRLANGISRCFSILLLNNRPISSTRYIIKTKKYSLAVLEKPIYYLVIHCSTYFQVASRHCVKCPYSEFFWSVFSHIRTEYGEQLRISPCSVPMRGKTNLKIYKCGHFSRSERPYSSRGRIKSRPDRIQSGRLLAVNNCSKALYLRCLWEVLSAPQPSFTDEKQKLIFTSITVELI